MIFALIVLIIVIVVAIHIRDWLEDCVYDGFFGAVEAIFWGLISLLSFGHVKNPNKKDKDDKD